MTEYRVQMIEYRVQMIEYRVQMTDNGLLGHDTFRLSVCHTPSGALLLVTPILGGQSGWVLET